MDELKKDEKKKKKFHEERYFVLRILISDLHSICDTLRRTSPIQGNLQAHNNSDVSFSSIQFLL